MVGCLQLITRALVLVVYDCFDIFVNWIFVMGLEVEPEVSDVDETDPKFHPPLYVQRYRQVADIIHKEGCSSVIDFGCSQCRFLKYLKNLPAVQQITGVDIDTSLLKSNAFLINPLTTDYIDRRDNPLTMRLYSGSVADCDLRMKGYEAVTMIEVIEHLEPEPLKAFPQNIFGFIQPDLVIITTPNVEFNVLFPNNSGGFRHWDHKFEWTRKEFEDWCGAVAQLYSYSVEYSGVGSPWSSDYGDVGYCSQTAVFRRLGERTDDVQGEELYHLVDEREHPYQKTVLSLKDRTCLEVDYIVRKLRPDDCHSCGMSDSSSSEAENSCSEIDDIGISRGKENCAKDSECRREGYCRGDTVEGICQCKENGAACSNPVRCERYTWPLREIHKGDKSNDSDQDEMTHSYDEAKRIECSKHFDESNMKLSYARSQLAHFAGCDNLANQQSDVESECSQMTVLLHDLIRYRHIKRLCGDVNTLRSILLEADYKLNHDQSAIIVNMDEESDAIETDSNDGSVVSGQFSDAENDATADVYSTFDMDGFAEESWD